MMIQRPLWHTMRSVHTKVHTMKMKEQKPVSSLFPTFLKKTIEKKRQPAVSVLDLRGVIAGDIGFGARKNLNMNSQRKLIDKAFGVKNLEAVLLNINSPGGSPAQSELISNYIQMLAKDKDVKVYSFVEDVAASGGYWLACAGEKIYVTENSIVGSIGVVSAGFGFHEVIKNWKIERRVHTAGTKKVTNDPFEPEKEEDVAIKKRILNKIHDSFKNHVIKNRGDRIKKETHEQLFNGEYWVGSEAIDLGLVDGINNVDNFVKEEMGTKVTIHRISGQKNFFSLFKAELDELASLGMAEKMLMVQLMRNQQINQSEIPPFSTKF